MTDIHPKQLENVARAIVESQFQYPEREWDKLKPIEKKIAYTMAEAAIKAAFKPMPIEDAPQDGSRVLGYRKMREDACFYETWWEPNYTESDYGENIGGWDDDWDMARNPTHFLPIPTQEPSE
jgi:hypothetical protein